MIELGFHAGTLEVRGLERDDPRLPSLTWDPRSACHRAPAMAYPEVLTTLVRQKIAYTDKARAYDEIDGVMRVAREPRAYQTEAVQAWLAQRSRGVVVLPTGAGKTFVAVMAIAQKKRSTLVVAPTLDLVRQWFDILREQFAEKVGVIGGGDYDPRPLTVTTYDSAYLHMENLGNRFGLIIFDECHHLPSEAYAGAARSCLAPFRLGLTATPERTDGGEQRLVGLIGPTSFRLDIKQLSGEFLADYETIQLTAELGPAERAEYDEARAIYRAFVDDEGIKMGGPDGWGRFIIAASRSKEGMRAFAAYRRQRELSLASPAKMAMVTDLVQKHRKDRVILFTQDNATAYEVSRRLLVPVITHQTKVKERSAILQGFRAGTYGAIATSKVLNEGVDVPEANVAIVISGSGSVREHVQRLGRILRPGEGKRAILYELVSGNTGEAFTSQRRREHDAYR